MRSRILRLVACLAFLVNALLAPSAGILAAESNPDSKAVSSALEFTADFFNALSNTGPGATVSEPIGIKPRPAVLKKVTLKGGVKPSDRHSFTEVEAVDNTVDSLGNLIVPPVGNQIPSESSNTWLALYYEKIYQEILNHPELDVTNPELQSSLSAFYELLSDLPDDPITKISHILNCYQELVDKGFYLLENMPDDVKNLLQQLLSEALNNARQFRSASWGWLANIDALAHFLSFTQLESYNESIKPYIGEKALDDIGNIFINNIKQRLVNGDLCVVCMPVFKDGEFDTYKKGILDAEVRPSTDFRGIQAIVVVGYDNNKQAFKIVNPWDIMNLGKNEFCWLSYKYSKRNMLAMAWQEDRDTPLAEFTAEPVNDGVKLTWNDGNNYAYDNEALQSYIITFSAPNVPAQTITLSYSTVLENCTYTIGMDKFYSGTYTFALQANYGAGSCFIYPQKPVVQVNNPNAPALPPDKPKPGPIQTDLDEARKLLENFVDEKIRSREGDIKQFIIDTVSDGLVHDVSVRDTSIDYDISKACVILDLKYLMGSFPCTLYFDMRVDSYCSQLGLCLPDNTTIFGKKPKTKLQFWYPENLPVPSKTRPFTVNDTIDVVNNVVNALPGSQPAPPVPTPPLEGPIQPPANIMSDVYGGFKPSTNITPSHPIPPEFLDNSLPPTPKYTVTGFDRVRGVTFFTDNDYKGHKLFLENSARTLSTQFDNKISSIKVSSGYYAVVYEKPNYEGKSTEIWSDSSRLNADWNNKISSVKVYKTTVPVMDVVYGNLKLPSNIMSNVYGRFSSVSGSTEGASFFEQSNFKGLSIHLTEGAVKLHPDADNKISSVKVTPGYRAVLFDDSLNPSKAKMIDSNTANLGTWDNKASAIAVFKVLQMPEAPTIKPPESVTFYEGPNCTRASMTLDYGTMALDCYTDNKIMSVKVDPNVIAVVYQDRDYKGTGMVLTPDMGQNLPSAFKNTISSIKVIKTDAFSADTVTPLNKQILEEYLLTLIKNNQSLIEKNIKEISGAISSVRINSLSIDFDTGRVFLSCRVNTKYGPIISTTFEIEPRVSNSYDKFGIRFIGIENSHISMGDSILGFLANILLAPIMPFIEDLLDIIVTWGGRGMQFWYPDNFTPSSHSRITLETLPKIVSGFIGNVLSENPVAITQTMEVDMGTGMRTGTITLSLNDIQCKSIDMDKGSVVIGGTLQMEGEADDTASCSEIASVDIGFIFYLNHFDNSWWLRIRGISNLNVIALDSKTREILCKEITKNLGTHVQAVRIGTLE